jgi:hypothetical protein
VIQFKFQHVLENEEHRTETPVLHNRKPGRGGGCGDVPFKNQAAEKFLDLGFDHSFWVHLILEKGEALYPVDLALLGRVGKKTLSFLCLTNAIEEFDFKL